MSIQRNCHVPVYCASESSVSHSEENMSCRERVDLVSDQSKSIRILEEFRRMYEERLRKIDEETSGEGMELKLKTLTSWVNDLGEQNLMLVETVEQLEREAAGRVTLLEERLKKSSHIALQYMSKLEEYDNQFLDLSEGKIEPVVLPIKTSNRLVQAQQTEEILKTRISNLQNDISGLLELIRRARFEASWDINGLSFLEVTYEDIFGSYPHQVNDNLETVSHMQATINMLHQQLAKTLEDYQAKDQDIKMLQEQVVCQQADIAFKDIQIKNFVEKMHELQSSCSEKTEEVTLQTKTPAIDTIVMENMNIHIGEQKQETASLKQRTVGSGTEKMEISVFSNKLENMNTELQSTLEENERLVKENEYLSSDLKNKTDVIAALTQHLTEVDKTFDVPERLTGCIPSMEDQGRIRSLCEDLKTLLQPQQQRAAKRGVSFASPTKEDYKLQVQELQKALKQAQNGAELVRKKISKNITELKEIKRECVQVINHYQEERSHEKIEEVHANENMLAYEMTSSFFGNSIEEWSHGKYGDNDCDIGDHLDHKIKEYKMKIQSLECDLFIADIMMFEKNKIIQSLMHQLHSARRMINLDLNQMESKVIFYRTCTRCTLCSMLHNNNNNNNNNRSILHLVEKLKTEIEILKSTVSANEKVILNQREMLNIQQEALMMSQDEVKELQNQLKKLEKYNEDENKQMQQQLVTISNLHHQLQELHCRSSFELKLKDITIGTLYVSLVEMEAQYKDCYGQVVKQNRVVEVLRNANVELSVHIFYLIQDIGLLEEQLFIILHKPKITKDLLENGEMQSKTLQSKYEDLESKFQEAKDYLHHLLRQVLVIEQEIKEQDTQESELKQIMMILITCIKDFCLKYLSREEDVMFLDDINLCEPNEHVDTFSCNKSEQLRHIEELVETEVTDLVVKKLKVFENMKHQNSNYMSRTSDIFKDMHLNELRTLLDAQVLQEKSTGKLKSELPMSYGEAIRYCNYMEHEINKLQDLLIDFQCQMNTTMNSEVRGQSDVFESQMKATNLKMVLNETCENYKMASRDCFKYQEQLLNAAEREVAQQEDFTAKERYWLEKMHQIQVDNAKYLDIMHTLNEEIHVLHLELNERDQQLQNTASSLRVLSSQSSTLQRELQKQEMNVQMLQEQLLQNNIKLQQALSYLDEKNNLLQELKTENHNMQCHLKKFEAKHQSNVTSENKHFLKEISNLKSNIQQLMKFQEKNNMEVREHWWWDDGWQLY